MAHSREGVCLEPFFARTLARIEGGQTVRDLGGRLRCRRDGGRLYVVHLLPAPAFAVPFRIGLCDL
jgi:hypothetical protein